jgi:hypothetical protein
MLIKPKFQEVRAFQYGVHPVPAWAQGCCSGVVVDGGHFLKVDQAENPLMMETFYAPLRSWLVLQPNGVIFLYNHQEFFSLLVGMEYEP